MEYPLCPNWEERMVNKLHGKLIILESEMKTGDAGETWTQIIMQMSIADIRVLFVTIIMNIIFKRFAAEHHTKIMSGRKRYWQPVSVELPKNSMDLWMDFLSTIMYIQKGLKSKEAQRSLMKMSGIRHWIRRCIWMNLFADMVRLWMNMILWKK